MEDFIMNGMVFSMGRAPRPQYESMTLCPDTPAGQTAFHEAIQDGWEIVGQWRDERGHTHFAMRRETR